MPREAALKLVREEDVLEVRQLGTLFSPLPVNPFEKYSGSTCDTEVYPSPNSRLSRRPLLEQQSPSARA
jgi:hypothetical protein